MLIGIISIIGGSIAFGLFVYYYMVTGNVILARSVAFAALGVNSLVFVFSVRTLTEPFWKENPFENKWLNMAVVFGLILQFVPFATKGLRSFFKLELPEISAFLLVFAGAFTTFVMIEFLKVVIRKNIKWFQH